MAVTVKGTLNHVPLPSNLSLPGIAVGDWVIAIVTIQATDATANTVPAGWQVIKGPTSLGTMGYSVYGLVYLTANQLAWERAAGSTNGRHISAIYGSGAMPFADWGIGAFANRATNATTLTAKAPSITASGRGLAVFLAAERTTAVETDTQITVNNGFTKHAVVTSNTTSVTVYGTKEINTAGPVGDTTVTFPNTHVNNAVAGHVFLPESTVGVPKGLPSSMIIGGSLVAGSLGITSDEGFEFPQAVRQVSRGYGTVTDMLEGPAPFTIAHRGGSVSFPEMSMYAYTQSTMLGYNALEMSLARTSDGVIYGLHDATLLRTSGVDIPPEALSWEQTQAYTTFGKPFLKFTDLIDLYPNHVIFVDPKHIPSSLYYEVLDIMDTHGPERFVAKYFGISLAWSVQARIRGYLTWGYYYDYNEASMDETQDRWDILGLDYNASQAVWDKMLGYGKRVVGHICPNNSAAQTALLKGATGLMISGTKLVVP